MWKKFSELTIKTKTENEILGGGVVVFWVSEGIVGWNIITLVVVSNKAGAAQAPDIS